MKLLRLEIRNFGTFRNFSSELTDGLNTVCRENGWGKSTLAAFIKAMLYGLPATRKSDLDLNERRKYQPWDGGAFGGSLEFECRAGRFRVERSFGARENKDEFHLFDLATGAPSDAFGSDIGYALFGIDADGFERSAYLSERALDTRGENATVRAKLTGLLENPDDMGCYDSAQAIIDRRRKYYEVKGGRGYINDLETELREKSRRLEELREKQTEQAAAAAALRQAERETAEADAALNRYRDAKLAAEKANAARRQAEAIRSELREKARRQKEILHAFGDGAVPTEEEISHFRTRLSEVRNCQFQAQAAALPDEEQRRLSALSQRFRSGIPTHAELDRADAYEQELREADLKLAQLTPPAVSPAVRQLLEVGYPSEAAIRHAMETVENAERHAGAEPRPQSAPVAHRRIPLAVPLLLLICGALLAALAFLPIVGALQLPLLICGIALLILSPILWLTGKAPRQPVPAPVQTAPPPDTSAVQSMLLRYGLHRAGGDLRRELTELSVLCDQAQAYRANDAKTAGQRAALREQKRTSAAGLQHFFAAYGLPYPSGDPARELARVRSEADELTALRERNESLRNRRTGLEAELGQKQAELRTFFARLTAARAGNQPEDCLVQIDRLATEYRQLTAGISATTERLNAFLGENQNLPKSDIRADGSEPVLREALQAAREKEQVLRNTQNRLSDLTSEIPELCDRVEDLREQVTAARANLSVLRNAADYLRCAKESLSTRYLGGMQQAFDRRVAQLEQSSGLHAVLDTQLSVSVRSDGVTRELSSASRGTRDLLRFCARLALTEVLCSGGEQPFLLLDDPFVTFDGAHLQAALAYLGELGKTTQILYLVCHESRAGQQEANP